MHSASLTGGTKIPELTSLQAISFSGPYMRVMGVTDIFTEVTINQSCDPVAGELPICGTNNDATLDYIDHYIAEFNMTDKSLNWSTLLGGFTDESAELALYRYYENLFQWHGIERVMDIESDENGSFFVMGIAEQLGEGMTSSFPTVPAQFPEPPAATMYYKEYDPDMGNNQSEVVLATYTADHELTWCSMFGAQFSSVNEVLDYYYQHFGSDIGASIVLVQGQALYLVGSTGGSEFDQRCPFVDVSYCEPDDPIINDVTDRYDGLIARFDMRHITIGIPESPSATNGTLLLYPDPAEDVLTISLGREPGPGSRLTIIDVVGREVATGIFTPAEAIQVHTLANGWYTVVLRDSVTNTVSIGRFIKT